MYSFFAISIMQTKKATSWVLCKHKRTRVNKNTTNYLEKKKGKERGRFMSQQQFQLEGFDQGQPQAGCNCLSPWRVGYDGACNIVFLHVQCNLMGLLYNLHGNIWSTPCGMEFHLHSPVSPKHIKIDKFPTPIDSLIPIVAFLSVTSKVALSTFSSN